MKRILCFFFFGLAASTVFAATEAKWLTSLPEAAAQASKEHKLVLMDFTGSDWCEACMELEKTVFSTPEFSRYASSNLILMRVDFPIHDQPAALNKANDALKEKYKIDGYPTLLLVKPNGKKVWENSGYDYAAPSKFIAMLDEAVRRYSK